MAPCGARLEFPKGVQTRYRALSVEQLERLDGELKALPVDSRVSGQFPESIGALRRLVARTRGSQRLSLVYRILGQSGSVPRDGTPP